jgi:hypothetical protein
MKELLEKLKERGTDRFSLDIQVAMYLGTNVIRRQEVLKVITGEEYPLTHCTLSRVSNSLEAYYKQLQLF